MDGRDRHQLGAEDVHEPDQDPDQEVDAGPSTLLAAGHADADERHDVDGKGVGGARVALQFKQALPTRALGFLALNRGPELPPVQSGHGLIALAEVGNPHGERCVQHGHLFEVLLALRIPTATAQIGDPPSLLFRKPLGFARRPLFHQPVPVPLLQHEAVPDLATGIHRAQVDDGAGLDLPVQVLLCDVELLVDVLHFEVHFPLVGMGQNEMGQHQAPDDQQRRGHEVGAHQPLEGNTPGQHRNDFTPLRQSAGEQQDGQEHDKGTQHVAEGETE